MKRAVREHAELFHATTILIEDKASGTQLIQELVRDGVYGITRYEPKMDKVMRLHSITSTIENGFVYLPTEAVWLADYLHELTTFPSAKHDDQADSTSQALDWLKQGTRVYGVLDYYRQEALANKLALPRDFEFTQCDDGDEILAAHKKTGQKIRWTGQVWVDADSNASVPKSEACPSCGARGTVIFGQQKRCQQCGHQWPPIARTRQVFTRSDIFDET